MTTNQHVQFRIRVTWHLLCSKSVHRKNLIFLSKRSRSTCHQALVYSSSKSNWNGQVALSVALCNCRKGWPPIRFAAWTIPRAAGFNEQRYSYTHQREQQLPLLPHPAYVINIYSAFIRNNYTLTRSYKIITATLPRSLRVFTESVRNVAVFRPQTRTEERCKANCESTAWICP